VSPAEDTQKPVIDFLALPESHWGAPVKRIDTHAAIVFLSGPHAIKIKRAVKFPFLDFSTLAKRKAACEAELSINRAFAPEIYRRVVPITREDTGKLVIGGTGAVVEWALEMNRFDETRTLDHLAASGQIDSKLAEDLGHAVAQAHSIAPIVKNFGVVAELEKVIAQNDAELTQAPDLFAPENVRALTEKTRAALARAGEFVDSRERDGFVRRCHGDLHLGNIVLLGDKPVLFDAIEFDERIATCDVFYDLAFLLMDLIQRGLNSAANIVLNRYLADTRRESDLDALAVLPLFMSLRAGIRAKVTAARGRHVNASDTIAQSAREYFALALRLIAPPTPQLIAIGGLSGTGKSLLARALAPEIAPEPGAIILRSDVERKVLFETNESEKLPPEAYTQEAALQVYKALKTTAHRIVSAGHSVIVDAVFADSRRRNEARDAAGNAAFGGLFLVADLKTRIARVGERTGDVSDADAAIAKNQEDYELGTVDWHAVDASGTPQETLRRAKVALHFQASHLGFTRR
jgi:aminoglycoside phosphotransferase family enzyme/predicted kinase